MFPKTVTESLTESIINQASYLSAEERLELLVMYCENASEIWMLQGENGFIMMESEEELTLPVWPHRDFALHWQKEHDVTAETVSVSLADFIALWAPGLDNNQTTIVAFPFASGSENMIVSAGTLVQSWNESERGE